MGLSEVVEGATKKQLEDHANELIKTIQQALCDSEYNVREPAALAFSTLHQVVGNRQVFYLLFFFFGS